MKRHDEQPMREHWESEASDYVFGRKWSPADARVLELLQPRKGDRLMEVGFGSGLVAAEIVKTYPEVTYIGVDFARRFMPLAGEILPQKTPLILASAAALPFRNDCLDLILEMDAIHHFPREIIPRVVESLAELLVPGGRLVSVEDWAAPPQSERDKLAYSIQSRRQHTSMGMEYHPSDAEWVEYFKTAGLRLETLEHVERPLNFGRFEELKDPVARKELAELRLLWGSEIPSTRMTLFICQKS